MSNIAATSAGTAAIRHSEVRFHAAMVKLPQAANVDNKDVNPSTVVTKKDASAADNNLGRLVDIKT
jgi:hypothetical protein